MGNQITIRGGRHRDRQVHPEPDDQGLHRGRPRGQARLRRDRHGRRRRVRADRLLQGSGEVGADVPHDRRRALLVPRRLRQGRRRRHVDPARPRQPGDQLRRREDLPRGGRGGGQAGRPASSTASSSASTTSGSVRPSRRSCRWHRRRRRRRGDRDRRRERPTRRATRRRGAWCSCAQVPRAPNGKADYKTAKQYALDAVGLS